MSSEVTFFYFWEILKHLELNPFLKIPVEFNHQACYQEALAALDKFVDHRNYKPQADGGPKWKSLALRALDGDHTKTLYHKDYGVNSEPNYQMSEVVGLFPETLDFLNQLTDVRQCERIRFMLLEPRAKIEVHTDAPNSRAVVACNVALNMPEGCDFLMETNTDGSLNEFSKKVPFVDGSVMLVNVAKYHYVENNSEVPRIHMIVHGPLKMTQQKLIQIAREANDIADEKDLVTAVNLKRALQGHNLSDEDLQEWFHYTLNTDRIHKLLKIVIVKHSDSNDLNDECLRMTVASLFPLQYEMIDAENLDNLLSKIDSHQTPYVAVIKAGHYVGNCYRFIYEMFRTVGRMKEEHAPLAGHLLFGGKQFPVPQLHDQFFILDLAAWEVAGKPEFKKTSGELPLASFEASPENFHDDYTPYWIKSRGGEKSSQKSIGFGTQALDVLLRHHAQIINISRDLREQKIYTYPEKGNSKELMQVRNALEKRSLYEKKKVYVFNNEPRQVVSLGNFKPRVLLSVAAGFKPMALSVQYPSLLESQARTHFVDFSPFSLKYELDLSKCQTFSQIEKVISPYWNKDMSLKLHEALEAEVKSAFQGNPELLFQSLHKMREATFRELNFYSQPDVIVDLIEKDQPGLFWHSNAFNNNLSLFYYSKAQIDQIYLGLVQKIHNKIGGKVFSHKWHREIIFTDSKSESVLMLMTDGVEQGEIDWHRYSELKF